MEFKSNSKGVFILLLVFSIIFSIGTALLFVFDPDAPDLTLYGTLFGVCAFSWLCTIILGIRLKNSPSLVFEKNEILLNQVKIPASEIQHVKISASLGTLKPSKPQYANIDLMVTLPPEKNLPGSIKIITSNRNFFIPNANDVMTAYTLFRDLGCDVEATYSLGEKMRKYIWGEVS